MKFILRKHYLEKLIKFYSEILERSRNEPLMLERIRELDLQDRIELTEELKRDILKEIHDFYSDDSGDSKRVRKYFSDIENYLSIILSVPDRLLMCGDAKKMSIRNAFEGRNEDNYYIVKVPHHGTSDYCLENHWNEKSKLLIPNSKLVKNWFIDTRYITSDADCYCLDACNNLACPSINGLYCKKKTTSKLYYISFNF